MKAVVFDLFGTLVPNLNPARYQDMLATTARLLEAEVDEYLAAWHGTFEQRMDGRLPDTETFAEVSRLLGRSPSTAAIERCAELRREAMIQALAPKSDAVACLSELRERGLLLALATDCSSETPELLDETPLGEFFSVRACSALLQTRKPDARMYEHVLNGLGVAGEECLYVGDGNSDELPGARRHGMTTVWVDNGAQQHFKERFSPDGDHTVQELLQILELLP